MRYEQEAESYGMSRYDLINPKWDNVYKFRGKWMQAVTREEEIQQKLKETKQKKKDAKAQVKEARKRARELDLGR